MLNVVFHVYSGQLSERVPFQIFCCYMPTSWELYHAVEQLYDLMDLELLVSNSEHFGASSVVGVTSMQC